MKLVTFLRGDMAPEVGVLGPDGIAPAPAGSGLTMQALISNWGQYAAEVPGWAGRGDPIPLDDVRLLAPVPTPSKILAIGLNYADHVAESGLKTPEAQIWFCKLANSVNGPYDPIMLPNASDQIDYEGEMVAIIGERARNVTREEAASHVFGYCVGNDVSTRDWQLKTSQWVLGKSADTHAPFGPWITTADEIEDPHALDIQVRVNGEMRQSSNTRHLIFDVFDQIVEVSKLVTLEPGDVIFTGTPGGVGLAMKPPRFLKDGDVVTCEISGLGHIEGVMRSERSGIWSS